ncbi:MAG: TIGR03560 family F420-dependent LLM class oxidoreductase [Nitrospinae bacterium]|nr:TIGR03560 family F420-dependent LLM class oxidoreductase [Nitrospinota bacterium]
MVLNVPDPVAETLECWTALSGLAHATHRMRIGTLVSGNTYRHPAVLAKMAATVDIMSGGRLICGLGAAWQKNEHVAYGIPFYTVGERLSRLDEACQVILALWAEHKATFKGRYYQLDDAPLFPKSLQKPHPELLIGGGGERRTLKIAAKYADHWNVWGGPEVLRRKIRILEDHCAAVGREHASITHSANLPLLFTEKPEEIDQLAASVSSSASVGPVPRVRKKSARATRSSGEKPSASPISCGRWRIGKSIAVPFIAAALGCPPSRLRWQSGQGVTMQSAPLPLASPVWAATIAIEFGSLAARIGKPQHFPFPPKSVTSAPRASMTISR